MANSSEGDSDIARGDHLRCRCGGYDHHGIHIGDGTVVHFTQQRSSRGLSVCRDAIEDFAAGRQVEVVCYPPGAALHPDQTCVIALSGIGSCGYHLVTNNCEHLAVFCKTGSKKSSQVRDAVERRWRYSRYGIIHPALLLAGPLVEVAIRAAKHSYDAIVTRPNPSVGPGRIPWVARPMFRLGEWYGPPNGPTHFRSISGVWFQTTGSATGSLARIAGPPAGITQHSRWWVDDHGMQYQQTRHGWFHCDALARWVPARPECQRKKTVEANGSPWLSTAPLGALNALIDVPETLQERVEAMRELSFRLVGDWVTYHLLIREAAADTSGYSGQYKQGCDCVRQTALWTLGMLNRNQHADTITSAIPGIDVIARLIADETQPDDVRCAAIRAVQLLNRPRDPVICGILFPAVGSSRSAVVQLAKRVLAGESPPC
jgi:hypothetical protein